jgi:hypothetical protein
MEYSSHQKEKYGFYDKIQTTFERYKVKADRIAVGEVNRIMKLKDIEERESRLKSLRGALDLFFSSAPSDSDPYGYQEMIAKVLFQSSTS